MLFKKVMAAAFSSILALSVVAASAPKSDEMQNAYAASECIVDTTTEYQTIRGFGGINLPEWITQGDMTDAQVQKAFGNGDDELGLTILRIYCSDDSNSWRIAVPTAKRAQALGATVFATPWNPPASMRVNGDGTIKGGKYQLVKSKYADYAQHLNSFCKYIEGQGINLYSISVQNEPDYAEGWTYWAPEDLASFIAQYGKAVTAGTNVKLMSPESFQYRKDIYTPIFNNAQALANVDLFGTHFYGTQRSQMDYPTIENSGKELWMTEVYVPNSEADSANRWPEAIQVAQNIHNGMVVGNLNAYVWWYIRRSYGLLTEDGNISKRGYCMGQYSKFVRPGDVRIDVTEQPADNVLVSAYKNDNKQVTIVAVNSGSEGYAQRFTLGSGEAITNIDRYRTSSNENIALTEGLEYDGSSFWAQLPAQSVSTFVVSLEGSGKTPGSEPDENGYFFHDTFEGSTDSWEGRFGSSVLTSGRTSYEGSEALLVQERSSSWQGVQKTLNSRSFKAGETYSFSVNALAFDGNDTTDFKFTLAYTGSDNETHYSEIASATGVKGKWVQLANTNYTIPEGATNLVIYVETSDGSTENFYIDDAYGAAAGTEIKGAGQPVIRTAIPGDVNFDGVVDSFDMITARKLIISGVTDAAVLKAADVDGNGKYESADLVLIQKFVLGMIDRWKETSAVDTGDNKWDEYVETDSADWINFYKDSIYSMGNTARLTSKLTAAENGQSLTLGYLGGSITEGKNYTTPFTNYVKQTFANGSFKEVNAGMSGTSSVVGLVRSEKDLLSQSPDIIFLEFSVNDHEGETYKKSFESLVKKCLSQPNDPAVIILINRSKGGFSSQTQMANIGKAYDVPIISMDNALTKAFNSGFLQTSDYYTDEYHPHEAGGKLIANCLAYYFRQAMKTENRSSSYTIPSTGFYGADYYTCFNASASDLTDFNAGSFTATTGYSPLPYGYQNSKNGNTPMTFTTNGKGLIIVFKANSSGMGNINVTVNGNTTTISGNKLYTWGGPDAELGYYNETAGQLNVSISMENPSEDFTIWGIGVIK